MEILVIEDSLDDVELLIEAFKESNLPHCLHVASDGEMALRFLRRLEPYTNAPRPDLILLDLNLPKKDGREVLAEIKSDPSLQMIPVLILTMSQAEEDINRAYRLHANCYITKPLDLDEFIRVVKVIGDFWFNVAQRPRSS